MPVAMPFLLDAMPLPLAVAIVSAIIAVLSSALLMWRQNLFEWMSGSKSAPVHKLQSSKANGSCKQIEDPSLLDPSKPVCRLLYGTQTGTAERFAKQLAKELKTKYGDSTIIDVLDVENYRVEERLTNEKLLVICMATYGDGEPTDNAADFYNWLVKDAEAVKSGTKEPYLQAVKYAVFGLGNKQYEHFNKIGKQVHKLLGHLGAEAILRCGEGDDDASIDDDFEKWCSELHATLDSLPDLVGARQDQGVGQLQANSVAAYEVTVAPPGSGVSAAPFALGSGIEAHHPFMARVALVRELHGPESERSCVHVEIEVSGSEITYAHGDHLAIYAQNPPEVVNELAEMLGTAPDAVITLRKPNSSTSAISSLAEPPGNGALTLRDMLAYFADVYTSPKREALLALAAAASDPVQAARLALMASPSPEGKEQYTAYIGKQRRSLLEVLRDYPSARPPIGTFFAAVAPRLQPRFYSISSSPALHPTSLHVTCAVVKERMPTGRMHDGVASSWLQRCIGAAGPVQVPVYLRRSHFKLPKDSATPIIMVGPGTGLAPFRGFLQERAAMHQSGTSLGPAVLFFGCRNRSHDYIYRSELEAWLQQGVLTDLDVAFSRDGPSKDYVQHHIERRASELWTLLSDKGAHLYVCGDAKAMAKDVHRALLALVQAGKGCSGTQAEGWVKELQDAGRYQRDVW